MALDRWVLDCAKRALGLDLRLLSPHQARLGEALRAARGWQREGGDLFARAAFDRGMYAAVGAQVQLDQRRVGSRRRLELRRARRVVASVIAALECVDGKPAHEQAARAAREAFAGEDERAEDAAQARRLLLRCGLLPSGADLLVRLDYAESRGLLPRASAEQAWLDRHRQLLLAEDEDGRFAVVLRYLESVFAPEFDSI